MILKLSSQSLNYLLVTLAVVLATHWFNLPIWVLITCLSFGCWRYFIQQKKLPMPNFWVLLFITLLMCVAIVVTFKGSFSRDASLSLLVVMMSLKLLETKTRRDYMLMIILAYFLVGNLFLFNQTIATFAISILPLLMLTATLINVSLKTNKLLNNNQNSNQINLQNNSLNSNQNPKFIILLAGKLLLQAVPVMIILFILFPRIPGPLWGLPQDANNAMTGLSDSLSFGNISELTKNSAIAFRVQFEGATPAKNLLYWRGPVLWHQENRNWLMSSQTIGLAQESLSVTNAPIKYTVTLEPHNRLWLLMLDMPTLVPAQAKLSHDYQVLANSPVRSRIRYNAVSHANYRLGTQLNERERIMTLQITEGENARTKALASTWVQLAPELRVQKALSLYRQQPFIYTLRPPKLGENPVDDFLFNTKKGFCEHYASSFVYLMRAAQVPARIVTGYQGGELNPNGNYLIVRQSDAHAWAEVWLENQGWVRVDPTAAVSPERIEQGIDAAIDEIDELPLMSRRDYPLLRRAFLNWDSVNNGWNQWVLGYDDQKQLDFLKKLSGKNAQLQDMIFAMIAAIAMVMMVTTYFLLKKNKVPVSPVQQLYSDYLKRLKRAKIAANHQFNEPKLALNLNSNATRISALNSNYYLTPKPGEGALDFATRAAIALPQHSQVIMDIANHYNALQFSRQPPAQLLLKLQRLVHAFNPN